MHWTQVFLAVAMGVYLGAFGAALFAVRRRTGQAPWGTAGGHHLAKLLGAMASFLLLLVSLAYVVDRRSVAWFGALPWLQVPAVQVLGAAVCVLAGGLLIGGEASLGVSFRVALPESRQPLVTGGLYRWLRNPQALSVDLLALGVFMLTPSGLALADVVLNVVAYELKIRAEEAYLRGAHGAAYQAYCARTDRYGPKCIAGRRGRSR